MVQLISAIWPLSADWWLLLADWRIFAVDEIDADGGVEA